jgi:hypothetical protein
MNSILLWVLAIVVLLMLMLAIFTVPTRLVKRQAKAFDVNDSEKCFEAATQIRGQLLTAIGALLVFLGLGVTIVQSVEARRDTAEQLRLSRDQYVLAREQTDSSRYGEAVLALTAPRTEFSGVYALARLAETSKAYRSPVAKILVAFMETRAARPQAAEGGYEEQPFVSRKLGVRNAGVQAAFTVLGRDYSRWQMKEQLVLRGIDLRHAEGAELRFERTLLDGVDLTGSDLSGAILRKATLRTVRLIDCKLAGVDVGGATFDDVALTGADLSKTRGLGTVKFSEVVADSNTKWAKKLPTEGLQNCRHEVVTTTQFGGVTRCILM